MDPWDRQAGSNTPRNPRTLRIDPGASWIDGGGNRGRRARRRSQQAVQLLRVQRPRTILPSHRQHRRRARQARQLRTLTEESPSLPSALSHSSDTVRVTSTADAKGCSARIDDRRASRPATPEARRARRSEAGFRRGGIFAELAAADYQECSGLGVTGRSQSPLGPREERATGRSHRARSLGRTASTRDSTSGT